MAWDDTDYGFQDWDYNDTAMDWQSPMFTEPGYGRDFNWDFSFNNPNFDMSGFDLGGRFQDDMAERIFQNVTPGSITPEYDNPNEFINYNQAPIPQAPEQSRWGQILDKTGALGGKLASQTWNAIEKDPLKAFTTGLGGLSSIAGMLKSIGNIRAPSRSDAMSSMTPEERRLLGAVNQSTDKLSAEGGEDEFTRLMQQRLIKAARGEGDVDPRLLREQEEARQQLQSRALKAGGPGATSSEWYQKMLSNLLGNQEESRFTNARQILSQDSSTKNAAVGSNLQQRGAPAQTAMLGLGALGNIANQYFGNYMDSKKFNIMKDLEGRNALLKGGGNLLGYGLGRRS